jgi:hypothetical protein
MKLNSKVPFGRKLDNLIIPPEIIQDKQIDVYDKMLFGFLLRDIQTTGECSPSIKRLSGFMNCSEVIVQKRLDKLRERYWINWVNYTDGTRLYRLYSPQEHISKEKQK